MKFNVELTEQADKDLRSIYLYISVDLNSPENAKSKSNVYGMLFYLLMNYLNNTAVMRMNHGTVEA